MLPSIPEVSTVVETVIDDTACAPASRRAGRVVYFNAAMEPAHPRHGESGAPLRCLGGRSRRPCADACRHPQGRKGGLRNRRWTNERCVTIGDDKHEWSRNYQMRGEHQTTISIRTGHFSLLLSSLFVLPSCLPPSNFSSPLSILAHHSVSGKPRATRRTWHRMRPPTSSRRDETNGVNGARGIGTDMPSRPRGRTI